MQLNLPILEVLEGCRNVLVAGMGSKTKRGRMSGHSASR